MMKRPVSSIFVFFISFTCFLHFAISDLGTAAFYGPPYLPTTCGRDDGWQLPSNGEFAAAGEGVWDNMATCGRKYVVRCVSGEYCKEGIRIVVPVVDYAAATASPPSASGATLVLSEAAFSHIANLSSPLINIEFQQL